MKILSFGAIEQVEQSARKQLGKDVLIKSLSDLDSLAKTEEDSEKESEVLKLVVIGTLFKNQPLKPNILKELSEDQVRSRTVSLLTVCFKNNSPNVDYCVLVCKTLPIENMRLEKHVTQGKYHILASIMLTLWQTL